jgi:predicted phosphodiesterase
MPKSKAGEVAQEYCRQNPDVSTRSLAIRMRRERPVLFRSYDQARILVRSYRGIHATKARPRHGVYPPSVTVPFTYDYTRPPPTAAAEWAPVFVPENCKQTLILADTHVPYHDERAIEVAIRYCRENHSIDSVIYNGDTHDCYHLSRFCKDPEARKFSEELENVKQLLDFVSHSFHLKWSAYKCGNHEYRFETYLQTKAPELIGTREFQLKVLYGLHDRKIEWVDSIIPLRIGFLWIIHGHELGGGANSPVNPARGAFLKANDIVLEGHYHRSSHHSDTMLRGTMLSCWSIGCLCTMHPEYAPINRWNQGFAVVNRTDTEGNFVVYNYKIINRKMVVNA